MKRRQRAEKGRFEQAVTRELETMIMSIQTCEHNKAFIYVFGHSSKLSRT